jgi:hypothetical protein
MHCAYTLGMANVRTAMPIVEVTAPDGGKSLWAAAVAHRDAVAAVKAMIPVDHVAVLSNQLLPRSPKLEGFRWGEVRQVEP